MGADYKPAPVEWRYQEVAWIAQAAAVQNTWYVVLAATGVYTYLHHVAINMTANNETLEIEVTIDGRVIVTQVAAVAGNIYQLMFNSNPSIVNDFSLQGEHIRNTLQLEGHNVQIRARKTTVVGAGTLNCKCQFAIE